MNTPLPSWRLIDPDGIRIVRLGETFAVYNPLSGDTHLIDEVTGAVLTGVAEGAPTEGELNRRMAELVEFQDEESAVQHLRYILGVLRDIGLIEPIGAC